MKPLAAPINRRDGEQPPCILIVTPVIFAWLRERELKTNSTNKKLTRKLETWHGSGQFVFAAVMLWERSGSPSGIQTSRQRCPRAITAAEYKLCQSHAMFPVSALIFICEFVFNSPLAQPAKLREVTIKMHASCSPSRR